MFIYIINHIYIDTILENQESEHTEANVDIVAKQKPESVSFPGTKVIYSRLKYIDVNTCLLIQTVN